MEHFKLIVYVPSSHADIVRKALGDAGAGIIGNYSHCSFSTPGTGRYKGNDDANPFIGEKGKLCSAEEERIEVSVDGNVLDTVISEMKKVHPYDEIAFDIYQLWNGSNKK